ncbi:LSU ribosomal protein L7/L12 (P1/P2) [Candidatus Vidania fulgoroideae]|nr:LSU ribosomal protein L7/L12 (P1/P2) [Candidatus Vidania fulgoroideae]
MKTSDIFKEICDLNIIKLGKLIRLAEEKFGKFKLEESSSDNKKKEEKDVKKKNLTLVKCGLNRIPVIKLIKDITNKSLIESKKILDKLPQIIVNDVDKDTFSEYKKKFEELGCFIE